VRRRHGEEIVDVLAHGGEGRAQARLRGGAPRGARPLVVLGDVSVDEARGVVTLGPWSAVALAREESDEGRRTRIDVLRQSRTISDLAFRQGELETLSLPIRLYLTVTESCNLRCRHCITGAPGRTRRGTARELRPWLLGRLEDAFVAAESVGFVHGGEALTSPLLYETLEAVRRAKRRAAARGPDVHLLTNGMLLDAETARRLVGLGVTSLGVSIDGASSRTNDALREGSRLQTVLENLAGAVRVREQERADLRIGISVVVTRSNVLELQVVGRLARELGLDWVKIEEMFPCTATARRELLDPRAPSVEQAMAALREELRRGPVVLVDHRDPPSGCVCEATGRADLAEFREADDFANRMRLHPCRAAWQQACVDPDGVVHPVDYDGPALGGLLETPFLVLWNNEIARAVRRDALGRIRAELRARCPFVGPP
jgi:MoaA/NifB/PqqE/SkfB family radical SAM enzyme